MSSATTCDATWAAAFISGLLNLNGPPQSTPKLSIEKNGHTYKAWLTSTAMPILVQTINTKGISCMNTNGYTFETELVENTIYNRLHTQYAIVYTSEGATNFYDALKQCNVETDIKYITQTSRGSKQATLAWKDSF